MTTLARLGMQRNWIYEAIATTRGEAGPHAAPVGVWTENGRTIRAALYQGSTTLANILLRQTFCVNMAPDEVRLHHALNRRHSLRFEPARVVDAPLLAGACAWIELRLTSQEKDGERLILESRVEALRRNGPVTLINRAAGLFLESLILSTRRHVLPRQEVEEQLRENARVITKVAPDSTYAEAVRELFDPPAPDV